MKEAGRLEDTPAHGAGGAEGREGGLPQSETPGGRTVRGLFTGLLVGNG